MVLAIDQGSSKTTVALVKETGDILGAATAGGACYFFVGVDTAFEKIDDAIVRAKQLSGLSDIEITSVFAGLAGANWPNEIEMLESKAKKHFGVKEITVCNDCVPALRAGSDKSNCIVLCAGSQFNCCVMIDGEVKQVLNNYIHQNDQGGEALGYRALQAVFDSHIGRRKPTVLTHKLLKYYGYSEVDELLLGRDRKTLNNSPKDTAPLVMDLASGNDRVALDVVYEFFSSIAQYAVAALSNFDLIDKDCEIVLSGGVFKSRHPLIRETISQAVHRISTQAKIVDAFYEPVVGAALLGLSKAGQSLEALDKCKESAEKHGLVRYGATPNTKN